MQSEINTTKQRNLPFRLRFFIEAKTLIILALPLMISQVAQTGMSFVDTVMAGRHSEVSLAGVAIGSSLWVPAFLALMGIMMAVTPMVAQAYGARRNTEIKTTVQQAVWLSLILGIGFMLTLRNLGDVFVWLGVEPDVLIQAEGYIQAVSWGLPALAGFQVLKSLNEGVHITRPFMYISVIALLINIPLNYVFIYGKLGLPAMGGIGCGWATAIILWLELLMLLAVTLRNSKFKPIHIFKEWEKPDLARFGDILMLGLPIGISFLIESSMFALIALFIAKLGATVVSGHQIAISFSSLTFMVPLSISMAITIRVGYSLGRNRPDRARFIGWIGIALTLFTATLSSSAMLFFPEAIASLYTENPEVLVLAIDLLILAALFQFSDAVQVSSAGALRGYKDTRFAFLVVLFAYWGVGLPLGYTMGLTEIWGESKGPHGFWIGLIVGLTLASVLLSGRFRIIVKRRKQGVTVGD